MLAGRCFRVATLYISFVMQKVTSLMSRLGIAAKKVISIHSIKRKITDVPVADSGACEGKTRLGAGNLGAKI